MADFDDGRIDGAGLCDRFATPSDWWVLGPFGNPRTAPAFPVPAGMPQVPSTGAVMHGPGGSIRWFPYPNREPTGQLILRRVFDWRHTDHAAAQLICTLESERDVSAQLCLGLDDGLAVWLDEALVVDRRDYGRAHGGLLHRDRFLFEERIPVAIRRGPQRLAVTAINALGEWGFNMRFVGDDGLPLSGLRFGLASQR